MLPVSSTRSNRGWIRERASSSVLTPQILTLMLTAASPCAAQTGQPQVQEPTRIPQVNVGAPRPRTAARPQPSARPARSVRQLTQPRPQPTPVSPGPATTSGGAP